ncbi:MAG: ATP-grasp fold amidoligase family protein [Sphaerochaetaceae bacterium]|nr:ATP-grasp fold amidoligase family protein [Sphaerochaetaceae bacterium]
MLVVKEKSLFDWFCDAVLLVFLSVLMGYGPDIHHVFIPAEILFLLTFSIRFLLKRTIITTPIVGWSLAFFVLSAISVTYANDAVIAFIRLKSVIQVLLFINLIVPYIKESEKAHRRFLQIYLLAILFIIIRLLMNTPVEIFLSSRLGTTIRINPNRVGNMFAIAAIMCLYLGFQAKAKWYWLLVPFLIIFSIYSGSRKAFFLLGVGGVVLILLQQKNFKRVLLAVGGGILALGVSTVILIVVEPLYKAFGRRFINMFIELLFDKGVDGSTSVRMDMIIRGLEMFKERPLFGWGLGAFTDLSGFGTYSHNNYIELLVGVGLLGLLVYYSLSFCIVKEGLKRFFQFEKKGPYVLSTAIIVAMLFDQIGRVTYTEEYSSIILAVCYAGIMIGTPNLGLDVFQLFSKIYEYIRFPSKFMNHLLKGKIGQLFSDKHYLSIKYRLNFGNKLNLKAPITYNEKLQWLKLHDRKEIYSTLVDKYAVREYVKSTIGEKYLIPLIGVYKNADEIDVELLPKSFVLKCTHDSGSVFICKDKADTNLKDIKFRLNRALKKSHYLRTREIPYRFVEPQIICEKYMVDESGYELKDYKVFCFNGVPKAIQVDFDRFSDHKRNIYDTNWNFLPVSIKYPNDPKTEIPKPATLDVMLRLASKLSSGLPHARIDFYSIHDSVYFGEITLYHGSGMEEFIPNSYNYIFGSWLTLPN